MAKEIPTPIRSPEAESPHQSHIRKNLLELKETLATRARIQLEIMKSVGESIATEGFRGEKIQVLPDLKDKTVIYIKTSHAQVQLDLHYDETEESMDSLRKDALIYPKISITAEVGGALYEIDGYDEETSAKIAGELLKQVERKKHPEMSGYKDIQFGILDNNTIIVIGKTKDGKVKRLGFFDFIDDEKDRIILYGYISHYFGKPLRILEEGQQGSPTNPDAQENNQGSNPRKGIISI